MTHPRLSINALSSFSWTFEQDLALWRALGVGWASSVVNKLAGDIDGRLGRMADAGIKVATVIGPAFDLRRPETWPATRDGLHGLIDGVARVGGRSVYITTGRTTGAPWEELLDIFAEAVAPSLAHARSTGVRLAFEPSLRTDVSFVHTLRDAIHVSERTGIGLIADFGNCWMERSLRERLIEAAPMTALVQICDVPLGDMGKPGPGGRVPFGEGDLPVARLLSWVAETGYDGPFDLELPGPLGETEGYEAVVRRGADKAAALLEELGL